MKVHELISMLRECDPDWDIEVWDCYNDVLTKYVQTVITDVDSVRIEERSISPAEGKEIARIWKEKEKAMMKT